MTEQEITRVIAEKVMGYKPRAVEFASDEDAWRYWDNGCSSEFALVFEPLGRNSCCMAAWDKFSEGRNTWITHHVDKTWSCGWSDERANDYECDDYPDRRRAMCECMAKAVVS